MILRVQQGLRNDGVAASLSQLFRWFEVPRRTMYYQSVKAKPKVAAQFAEPIKAMIEENPSFGYRTVAHLLGFNKNTVQRIFQIQGWQVRKRAIGMRPRIQGLALCGQGAERTLVDGSMPHLGWVRRLGIAGPGHRLPYARVAGLAPVSHRPRDHGRQCAGTAPSSPDSEHWGLFPSRSCCAPTMG